MGFNQIKKTLKKYWQWPALIIIAVCFFIGTSSYNYFVQQENFTKWSSPDETSNYIFTKLYAQTGQLEIFEKYNLIASDIIHPRSMRSDWGEIKPVSFLGIILIYGKIAHYLGYQVIPYLTPFFGALGIIFFYLLVTKFFDKKIAFISALVLATFPPYVYYTARSMFHNVLFVVLLIIGLYFSVLMTKKREEGENAKKYLNWPGAAVAGLFIGGAAITRTSELLWLAPLLFFLWLVYLKIIGLTKLLIFLSFFALAFLPIIYWNQILYSSPIKSGYPDMNAAITNISQATTQVVQKAPLGQLNTLKEQFRVIKDNIFYFGFNLRFAEKMFENYLVKMFFWLFWPALFGFLIYLARYKKIKKNIIIYSLSLMLISAILIIYYGSWKFNDNPDPAKFTIGNSYTRYWLPVYLGLMPFFSYFLINLARSLFPFKNQSASLEISGGKIKKIVKHHFRLPRKSLWANGFIAIVLAFLYLYSLTFVLYGSEEGLIYSAQNMRLAKIEQQQILNNTESNALVITFYADKILFPERKIIIGNLSDNQMNLVYQKLSEYIPLYYYGFNFKPADIDYLNNSKFGPLGLEVSVKSVITKDFTLYKINKKI